MRKLVLFMHVSLDGFASDASSGLGWISYDGELQQYADAIVATVGSPVYGRVTYELMAGYWPKELENPNADERSKAHAQWVDKATKFVFSRTMKKADWNNTIVINDNIAEEINKLKQQPGKDLVIFGSPGLAHSFMELDLIDEYQLTLNPVLLGGGKPIYQNIKSKTNLKLIKATPLKSGVVGLHYSRR
ncbi:MAG: dihydrofolate reductase family protein [Bacteroidota bacterium]|nr:dihydrofolate reductase family protein [Bacteroidota bacterium]MDP4245944.1 dihydrofolate reductase family protein [Bacteroidota bacterium]MDP4256453.1 dihydrofolate reductase family protein [Bacteroidota bacterium]MDP4260257.1 dihydrofolate reductase family protein [Bacteroidota bacterium]